MRFGVLGPLAVWTTDDRPVTVPEPRVRALLADLLVHAGRLVPADRLVDDLWGRRPPANPMGTLQTRVWQLRRALEAAEPGGRALVVSRPTGYLLQVADDAVDAGRFRDRAAEARAARDPRVRADLLTDALALWRGPAFADVGDAEFTRAAIDALEELRLVVLEEQAEARLELGEHGVLAGELADPVSRHPLRERLRAAHMLALYRAGRQADALASYAEVRAHLAEELGIDPGPELVALHRAVLAQDPLLVGGPVSAEPVRAANGPAPASEAAAPPRTNLPAPVTELIGRSTAVDEVRALLGTGRLVTLTGPGGVGKTRLAVAAAARLADSAPDGVWLVELAAPGRTGAPDAMPSPDRLAEVVAATLGLRDDVVPAAPPSADDGPGELLAEGAPAARRGTAGAETGSPLVPGGPDGTGRPAGGAPAVRRLAAALRAKRTLLVLDNCEHVIGPAAELVGGLLREAPELRVLATSREPMAIAGEVLYAVAPLDVPDPAPTGGTRSVEDLSAYAAVRLFLDRAGAAAPGFAPGPADADAVAAICRRLDGIPLALELAATRVRVLGLQELSARLDDRFGVLAAGKRGAPARQQTLRAAIDWSWELLTAAERIVLRRLAAQVDGCVLDAAEAVCAGEGVRRSEVLDLLARLVDRSLVTVVDGTDGPRYRVLESVAAYCDERLREAGEWECVQGGIRAYYADMATAAEAGLRGPGQQRHLRRLDAEAANLRAALDCAVRADDAECALRLVNAMAWYWFLRGRLREGRRALDAALSVGGGTPAARAAAMGWHAGFGLLARNGAETGPDTDPMAESEAALRSYAEAGADDPGGRARTEWFLGFAQSGFGDLAVAAARVDRALAAFRALDDQWGVAAALSTRASIAMVNVGPVELERDGEESARIFARLGDGWGRLNALSVLGIWAEVTADYARAAEVHREGLRIAEELDLRTEASYRSAGLGRIALLEGDYAAAAGFHERARRLAVEQADERAEQFAEVGLALGARRQGRLDTAETHLRRWLDWCRQRDGDPGSALILAELGFVAEQRGDTDAALALHHEGLDTARATGDPRAIALALEGLAGVCSLDGRPGEAARLLGAAAAARASVGTPLPPAESHDVDRVRARTHAALGDATFTTEYTRGTALGPGAPWEDAVVRNRRRATDAAPSGPEED